MNTIINFTNKFRNNILISLNDIKKEFPKFYKHRLVEWQKQGYIKKIIRGFYILSDLKINEQISCYIANKIYEPSYISLETALRYYNIIPEQTFSVTSIATLKTKKFKTSADIFSYKNINPQLFFGYEFITYNNVVFKLADLEKTILDYFYFHRHIKTEKDFIELRFNLEILKQDLDKNKINRYLLKYSNKSFIKIINNFLNFVYHD